MYTLEPDNFYKMLTLENVAILHIYKYTKQILCTVEPQQ